MVTKQTWGLALVGWLVLTMTGCGGGTLSSRPLATLRQLPAETHVARGTQVPLQLDRAIRSGNRSVTQASLRVVADVRGLDGQLIVRGGTTADAEFLVEHSAGGGRPGEVRVLIHGVPTTNGTYLQLSGMIHERGRRRTGAAIGLGFGMMIFLGPFAWLFFGKRGENPQLPAGHVIIAVVP